VLVHWTGPLSELAIVDDSIRVWQALSQQGRKGRYRPGRPGSLRVGAQYGSHQVEDCVEHIGSVAQSSTFQETSASRMALNDQLIQSRVHLALDRRFGSSTSVLGART
jgi:hypothetical protein